MVLVVLALTACDRTTREAHRMVRRAEQLADTLPDSTVRLVDSVLRMPANFSERERMDMALLQAEALFGDRGQEISPVMDDDFFDNRGMVSTSPELERAAAYYAKKKEYAKAAHAALYSGFVQQHYDEKETAMRSFKDAERYGGLAGDSLTVARAEYWMAKLLLLDGMEQEALSMLQAAELGFDDRFNDRALMQNLMGVCYMLQDSLDMAEKCFKQSLAYSEKENCFKVRRKALNNYSVLFRLLGNYEKAISCLKQINGGNGLTDTEETLFCLNLGKVFEAKGEIDSTLFYYQQLEVILPNVTVKNETKVSVYSTLTNFAEKQGDMPSTLYNKDLWVKALSLVLDERHKLALYRIQQQYDYESLQNEMNRKLIRKQNFNTFIGVFAIIGLVALTISQIRLAKNRKQEAETKANLFHFMQQNKELTIRNEEQKQNQIYLTQKNKESEQANIILFKEKETQERIAAEYGEKLSQSLIKEQSIMLRLHLFIQNQGDEELLRKLEKVVFGKQSHMDAMMAIVDLLYPKLREVVKQEDLGLDENEQLDVIMSYFNISRQDEALLLHKTTDMVDKIRNRSRKKIQSAYERINLP